MIRWNLTGTENQKAIAREAFNRIHFPFQMLSQLPGTPELGWRDLNSGGYLAMEDAHAHDHGRTHEDPHDSDLDIAHPLVGWFNGRRWVMGIIYTLSGRIYLDVRLEGHPQLAMAVVAAEIAHAVDFFLPMTDHQRNELLRLWGKGGTWWEVYDYGSEYFRLGGEAFMHEFVAAYTDLDFGSKDSFLHDTGVEPEDVRRVLGIQRTDYVAPLPPPPEPEPEPAEDPRMYKHFPGGADIYHRATHYAGRTTAVPLETFEGFRPCKICKPGVPNG